jgi:hypothetical protein
MRAAHAAGAMQAARFTNDVTVHSAPDAGGFSEVFKVGAAIVHNNLRIFERLNLSARTL